MKFDGLCSDTQIFSKDGEFSLAVNGHSVEARLSRFPVLRTGPESTQIRTETWHHIAVTFDSTNHLAIYIDGYLEGQASVRGTRVTNSNNYKIGSNMEGLVNRISVYPWRMDAEAVRKDMFTAVVKADTTAFFDFSVNPPKDQSTHNWPLALKEDASMHETAPVTAFGDTSYAQPVRDDGVNPGGADNNAYTIQAWVYPISLRSNQAIFVNSDTNGDNGVSLWVSHEGGKLYLNATHGTFDGTSNTVKSTSTLDLDNWHNVACTYDGTNLALFINGVADHTAAEAMALTLTPNRLLIGGSIEQGRPSGAFCWRGYIQSVYVWNKALTAADLVKYQTVDPIMSDGLLAAYGLDSAPARNRVTGTPIGLCDGADLDSLTRTLPDSETVSEWVWEPQDDDDILPPPVSDADLLTARQEVATGHIVQVLEAAQTSNHEAALREFVPTALMSETVAAVDIDWQSVIDAARADPFSADFLEWHRIGDLDVLVNHGPEFSTEVYQITADSLDACTMWKISFIFSIIMAVMTIFGITAMISDKVSNYLKTRILVDTGLMAALQNNSASINAAQVFVLITQLYQYGVLWPVTKMILISRSWFYITQFLVKLITPFLPAVGAAELALFIARLIVGTAKVIISYNSKPAGCELTG